MFCFSEIMIHQIPYFLFLRLKSVYPSVFTVHSLKPADIKVVASLGDSIPVRMLGSRSEVGRVEGCALGPYPCNWRACTFSSVLPCIFYFISGHGDGGLLNNVSMGCAREVYFRSAIEFFQRVDTLYSQDFLTYTKEIILTQQVCPSACLSVLFSLDWCFTSTPDLHCGSEFLEIAFRSSDRPSEAVRRSHRMSQRERGEMRRWGEFCPVQCPQISECSAFKVVISTFLYLQTRVKTTLSYKI